MKLNILKYITLSGVLLLTSCSDDFLETAPTDSTGVETVFESTANAKLAINGIARIMTNQHLGSQGFNGEGTIKMYYGNYPGNDFVVALPGWASIINSDYHENVTSVYNYYPWHYYYKLIANANEIIHNIDGSAGPQTERDYIKAQALTYRAYSYTMLSQIYGNRWSDSNNGATKALVLRLEPTNDPMPLASLGDVYAQIYVDLDLALSLFDASGYTRPAGTNFEIDKSVTHAVYARAAITREDYPKAMTHAEAARVNHALMSVSEYKAGFSNPNKEWIWSSYGALDETLYFYSYFAYMAYNSSASAVRTYPKRISKELYDQIPDTDIRKDLFLNPEGFSFNAATGAAGADLISNARSRYPEIKSNATIFAHMQFKVDANDMPGVGNLNHFRSSEMYLIEAEARYFINSQDPRIAELLEELTASSGRDPDYTVTATGSDLLTEIKKYRAIELWGEGFDWFDYKRWNDPIVRHGVDDGGNFLPSLAVTIGPDEKNKWTWKTPQRETDNNELID
ncbi:RagB/SusD family nutrient uptake outer membrane protein [Gelidibacter gilvus]|uniref:RagB/SusD family nutrient uptake outer membrane protein n=1 Tax=Gelidibacter gilvus TaxID=59602 RepID=A0A4Q0XF82_9FLAO|nr:RagB/SusD family nutrient uptake outer membrane protein [Gelidibacter gilvus]RXJ46080.1 RagB/SusD family nutrient uptake outer membrane protein [Gelidibacter gilvus]